MSYNRRTTEVTKKTTKDSPHLTVSSLEPGSTKVKRTVTQQMGRGLQEKKGIISEASFEEEYENNIREYGANPFGDSPPTNKDVSKASEKGLTLNKTNSPQKKKGMDPYEEAENQHIGNILKLNADITHQKSHYDDHTTKARNKAKGHGINDPPDKLEILKDQNIQLKNNKKELEQQVKLIAVKLQRQIKHLKADRFVHSAGGRNKITKEFEVDFDELLKENTELQEQERELMDKVKKLQAKRKKDLKEGKNLYSVATQAGEDKRAVKHEQQQRHVILALQQTLEGSQKELLNLATQQEELRRLSHSDISVEALSKDRIEIEHRVIQARSRLEDVKANLKVRDEIFNSGKTYEDSLFQQLKAAQNERSELENTKRMLQTSAMANEQIRERITDAKKDRDRLQVEFENIMKKPFFRREKDQGTLQQLDQLESKIDEKKNEIDENTRAILKLEKESKQLDVDSGVMSDEVAYFKDQISRMKIHLDPTSLTIGDIMKKLKKEDEARFREVMDDLQYDGKNPNWLNQNINDQLNQLKGFDKKDDPLSMEKIKENLVKDKSHLVNELVKTQGLLAATVDIDKQQAALYQAELNQLQYKIKAAYSNSNDLNLKITQQNKKLILLQESMVPQGLTSADLERFNKNLSTLKREVKDDDNMTEFSAITDETEIAPLENLLDLRISTANIDKTSLISIMGGQEFIPTNVQTFLAVDFYNHDTKTTDLAATETPVYNTLFSFKNKVDDFYLKHLQSDTILVDVFLVPLTEQKTQKTIKIGSARLPLNKLIERDYSFQAQEIVHEQRDGSKVKIGRLFYRMRMRKDLEEAKKWQNQTTQIIALRDPTILEKGSDKHKLVEIIVKQAFNLKNNAIQNSRQSKPMQPFFSYNFYTFEDVVSHCVTGNSPDFEHRKQFEVAANTEFLNYMRKQYLKIDFMDESVDITQPNLKDFIGSVRIPLAQVIEKGFFNQRLPLHDELNKDSGEVQISIKIQDEQQLHLSGLDSSQSITQSRQIQQGVITKIVHKLADSRFDDIDLLLNMLFMKDTKSRAGQIQTISRAQLKEFFLQDIKVPNLSEQDIDIFLKTHSILHKVELFTREHLKTVLEGPFNEAREQLLEQEANSTTMYGNQAIRNTAHQIKPATGFGQNLSPTKAHDAGWLTKGKESNQKQSEIDDFERDLASTLVKKKDEFKPSPEKRMDRNATMSNKAAMKYSESDITDFLQKNLYDVIQSFQREVGGPEYPEATLFHTKAVLKKIFSGISDEQCEQFQSMHQDKQTKVFQYKEELLHRYQTKKNLPVNLKRSPVEEKKLQTIKMKLYAELKKKNYSLEDFFGVLDKNKSKSLTLEEWTNGTKGYMNDEESVALFRAIDVDKSGQLEFPEITQELIQIRAAMALDSLEKVFVGGKTDAAAEIFQFDKDKSGTLDPIEFANILDSVYRKLPREEFDELFRAIDRQNRGYLTEQDLRNAMKNKEESLVDVIFINAEDILHPLYVKTIKRSRMQVSQLWSKHSRSKQMGINEFKEMISFHLGLELTEDETTVISNLIREKGKKPQLDEIAFGNLMQASSFVRNDKLAIQNEPICNLAMLKLGVNLQKNGKNLLSQVENFQTFQEKEQKEICKRNLKHFLHMANLSPLELECTTSFLDKGNEGYIAVADLQKKYPSEADIKTYKEKK